ncbi:MAG: tetratricopeptide repeat protein [Pseudomonadota bacterium]
MRAVIFAVFAFFMSLSIVFAQQQREDIPQTNLVTEHKNYLERPLIERYILDELRQLRKDLQSMEAKLEERLANARLDASDRAIKYTTDTTNNIFYIITAAASLLVLVGWKSLKDIRDNIGEITNKQVSNLTEEYEKRLNEIELKMKVRSEQIMYAQEEISITNQLHSLWMRAGIEKNDQEKIKIYDQILELKSHDVEALTYKADTLLDIGEKKWALSLTNQAIEKDPEYSFAYWQRACAHAELENQDLALNDIRSALEITPSLKKDLIEERYFHGLHENKDFREIFGLDQQEETTISLS